MSSTRMIRARRVEFEYTDLPRHYIGGDLVMSHVVTVLSSLFPEGEDFFVRSVRNYRDEITDPTLKPQVAGFIGQEAIHGREHRSFNARLRAVGYPTWTIDRLTRVGFLVGERVLPRSVQLAITAALEHYTATLAEVLLADPSARAILDIDEVRSLFLWHALEESEHRAVAFDVFQAVSGNQAMRVGVMHAVTAGFLLAVIGGTLLSMAGDPAARDLGRVRSNLRALRTSPWISRKVIARIRDYNRRDFHPDDHDNSALIDEWRATLFGQSGALADRLRSA